MHYEISFLGSLALTILIESIALWIIVWRWLKVDIPISSIVITGVLASFATLPYVWFIFPVFLQEHWLYVFVSECFAVLFETVIIKYMLRLSIVKSFVVSFTCNMASFIIGLVVN